MELTPGQVTELKRAHRGTREKRSADKIKAVLMLGDGFSCEQVAKILLMDDDTVRGHGKRYVSGGLPGLLSDGRKGSSPRLDECQMALLDAHLSQKLYATTAGIIHWIRGNFGIRYSRSGAAELLGRMGYVYKKPKKMPKVAGADVQREFVDRYNAMAGALGPEDAILFMDGVHPLHNSVAAHGWFKKGNRAHLPSNTGRKRISINGALDIRGGKVSVIECERIDAQAVIGHLGQIMAEYGKGAINIVLDNARYYRAKVVRDFLEEHPRIRLMFLPPYCPNLNIIERLWLVMKREVVFNRYYEKFENFREAIMGFFEKRAWAKPCYDKILSDNFHILETNFFSGFKTE